MLELLPADFSIIVDSEITLYLPKTEEAEELFALVNRNRTHLREFLGWLDVNTKASDSKKFIETNLPQWQKLQSLHLSIKKNQKMIGAVGLHQIDFVNKSTFMGYWLDKEHEGQGIVTKSMNALINFCFDDLKLHRLQLVCALHNQRSQNIAIHLGFEKEGLLKEAIHHYGQFFDAYLYGKIKAKKTD